jgi:thiol-disulfide isomerase/thioredoxin
MRLQKLSVKQLQPFHVDKSSGAILALLTVALLFTGCNSIEPFGSPGHPEPSPAVVTASPDAARDFTLLSLDGDPVTLSDLKGQWVLINFWATWCPPCVSEMPYLQRVSEERDMVVLGINYKETAESASRFVEENEITFPILMNPDEIVILFYEARSLPRTYVIDPDGNVALRIVGEIQEEPFDEWLDEQGVPRRS